MGRARHRWCAWGLIIGGIAAWLLVGGTAHAADPPTATFTSIGAPPIACGSRPDVTSLTVSEGTAVVIANHVGVPGQVTVARQPVLTIEYGEAALLTLAAGSHEIELVPQCRTIASTQPLTVTVTPAAAPPSESPSSPPPGTSSSSPPGPEDAPPAPASAGPGAPTTEAGAAVAGPAPREPGSTTVTSAGPGSPSTSTSESSRVAPGPSGAVRAEAIPWTKPPDPKGVRLLAVIAAICVLGVTAAIIRSIVRLDA